MNPDCFILYQVQITLDAKKAEQYVEFMKSHHIPDMQATGCFSRIDLNEDISFVEEGKRRFRCQFYAKNRDMLNKYLEDHATDLRQHFIQHMGTEGGLIAERSIFSRVADFD